MQKYADESPLMYYFDDASPVGIDEISSRNIITPPIISLRRRSRCCERRHYFSITDDVAKHYACRPPKIIKYAEAKYFDYAVSIFDCYFRWWWKTRHMPPRDCWNIIVLSRNTFSIDDKTFYTTWVTLFEKIRWYIIIIRFSPVHYWCSHRDTPRSMKYHHIVDIIY